MKLDSPTCWSAAIAVALVLTIPMFWAEMYLATTFHMNYLIAWFFAPGAWIDKVLVHLHLISAPPTGGDFPDLRFLFFFPLPFNFVLLSFLLRKVLQWSQHFTHPLRESHEA